MTEKVILFFLVLSTKLFSVISTKRPIVISTERSEWRDLLTVLGDIFASFTLTIVRFLDFALRAPLEMTGRTLRSK